MSHYPAMLPDHHQGHTMTTNTEALLRDFSSPSCPESCSGCKHEHECVISQEDGTTHPAPTQPEQAKGGEAVAGLLRDMEAIAAGSIRIPAREYAMHALADFATRPAPAASVSDEVTWEQIAKAADAAGYDVENDCTKRDISTRELFTGFARAILALRPAQAGDQWREAVEEQFAVNHLDMPEDPREAIKKLIATEVRDALDPTISSAAAEIGKSMLPAEHTTDQ